MSGEETDDAAAVTDAVEAQSRRILDVYRADPGQIEEHSNNERRIAQGGYGDRQIFELVQNAADEMRQSPGGEIAVVLTSTHLYCANEGNPVTAAGAETILRMSVSRKRGGQIGRFGVGVKSVLAVSDTPQFFSKIGGTEFGFGFDREWSAEQIRAVHPDAVDTPTLRMAIPLDPARLRQVDAHLNELLNWAVTVVRLPLKRESVSRLARDLDNFPVEFLLFSSHVGAVTLEDRRPGGSGKRQIYQRVNGDRHTLEAVAADEVTSVQNWRVFHRSHRPSAAAVAAAGELHDRPEIDVSWAVPERSGARGAFWAFFPTTFGTTLRGILNAPWKTSEDRQAIFDGNAFNEELLKVAAELVVDSLTDLCGPPDLSGYIDYLPGRGKEAPQFADERLTAAIWSTAARQPSLVDQHGVLRRPSEIRLHPEGLQEEWLELWREHPHRPAGWVHHSAERRERRARVHLILNRAEVSDSTVRQWLEALVADGSAKASALAVRIAASMVEAGHSATEDVLRSRIVLTDGHGLVPPARGKVYQRPGTDELRDELVYVMDAVATSFGVARALEILGIREADAAGRFAAVVDQGLRGYSEAQWLAFWDLARAAGPSRAIEVLQAQPLHVLQHEVHVRTSSGVMHRTAECLLPGAVVPRSGRDSDMAVDMEFHAADGEVLRTLGLVDRPVLAKAPQDEPWFGEYRTWAWERYVRSLDGTAHRPQEATMRIEGADPAGPLRFLMTLSTEGRADFLHSVPMRGVVTEWSLQVGRQSHTRTALMSPFVWMARKHGYLHTSLGLTRVVDAVAPSLAEYARILPVVDGSADLCVALRLPAERERLPQRVLHAALVRATHSEDETVPGAVYDLALECGVDWPEGVRTRCRVGSIWTCDVNDDEIVVTALRSEYDLLVAEGVPVLLAPTAEAAARMVAAWGMLTPDDAISREIRYVAESEAALLDVYPHLRIAATGLDGYKLVRCSELEQIVRTAHGIRTTSLDDTRDGDSVLVLRPADDLAALLAVDKVLSLGLGAHGCRSVLDRRRRQEENERRRTVRDATTPQEKILRLIGEERLRAGLPHGLEDAERPYADGVESDVLVADLAISAYGDGVLRHYGKDIAALDDGAPTGFTGSTASRQFVADLGLPESFAGASVVSPPELEEVHGPSEYPRLHAYQERMTEAMVELLTRPVPARGMLRLPTGAGKTRVAVEAVIRVVRTQRLVGPILWIAQSDELCEQAVESWRFVWSKVGPDERLTINRFWGSNAASPVVDNTHLVVATDSKLQHNLATQEYAWLREPSMVVVDEAHRTINARFTGILEQLGLTRFRTARPLVGLTATPYRGLNVDETNRLVERFGKYRLDEGLFGDEDPYQALQATGVLARVVHRELPGSTLTLSDSEVAEVAKFGVLPASAEAQLAQDGGRNDMLLQEIGRLDPDWPVLVFAVSVNHAKLLTAMLNRRGISSAAIDGFTPIAERRRKIDAYRRGRIRVITNYGVLAQGFDAPATRAVVIARPTYSPNVYQQMIGRGLRGPKNNGKEDCLILDVRDNIRNYGEDLAFTRFDHLWSPS